MINNSRFMAIIGVIAYLNGIYGLYHQPCKSIDIHKKCVNILIINIYNRISCSALFKCLKLFSAFIIN